LDIDITKNIFKLKFVESRGQYIDIVY